VQPQTVDHERIYDQIGREIAQQRVSIGLSQADLARTIGLTRSSISNIEKGRQKMLVHTLVDIATALHLPASSLLPPVSSIEDHTFSGSNLSNQDRDQIAAIVRRIKSPR
jgi:transcriptional regulator with XRE-family HTH domain